MLWDRVIDSKYPLQVIDVTYGPTLNNRGTSMSVVLGPAAGMMRTGSSTRRGSLAAIMTKLLTRDPLRWVAAHLLNAELGGNGLSPQNLAPLTQTANKRHSGMELKVKKMCIVARQKQEFNSGAPTFFFGIKYSVRAVGQFGTFDPYSHVPSHFVVNAAVYKYDTDGTNERALSPTEQTWFAASVINNEEVHNKDEDL